MVSDSRSYKAMGSLMVAGLLLVVYVDGIFYVIHVTLKVTTCHKPGKPYLEFYQLFRLILFFITWYQE
jgi:hypothetical protein